MDKVTIKSNKDGSLKSNLTNSLRKDLGLLLNQAENAHYFQNILNKTLDFLYQSLPNGKENYGEEKHGAVKNPKIGYVWLTDDRWREDGASIVREPHVINIRYAPSSFYEKKFGYLGSTVIGIINLQEGTYNLKGEDDLRYEKEYGRNSFEVLHHLPIGLVKDTPKVLKVLGLKKQKPSKEE